MKRLCFAPAALADLRDITLYIAEDNPDRAFSFVAELEERARAAATNPHHYRERPEIAEGIRAVPHGRYLLYFRDLGDEVRIVRVLHGAKQLRGTV
jgi:toxin ParE1/3/4